MTASEPNVRQKTWPPDSLELAYGESGAGGIVSRFDISGALPKIAESHGRYWIEADRWIG
jgi:hypothetical protein